MWFCVSPNMRGNNHIREFISISEFITAFNISLSPPRRRLVIQIYRSTSTYPEIN